jgi:hypothetical protein
MCIAATHDVHHTELKKCSRIRHAIKDLTCARAVDCAHLEVYHESALAWLSHKTLAKLNEVC